MTDKQLGEYKTKLEKERLRLFAEIEKDEKPVDFGNDVDHLDEEADEAEEMSNQLAAAQGLKDRLDEIDLALSKIKSGEYGTCEKCGGAIEPEILSVDPESRLCKSCKLAA